MYYDSNIPLTEAFRLANIVKKLEIRHEGSLDSRLLGSRAIDKVWRRWGDARPPRRAETSRREIVNTLFTPYHLKLCAIYMTKYK